MHLVYLLILQYAAAGSGHAYDKAALVGLMSTEKCELAVSYADSREAYATCATADEANYSLESFGCAVTKTVTDPELTDGINLTDVIFTCGYPK